MKISLQLLLAGSFSILFLLAWILPVVFVFVGTRNTIDQELVLITSLSGGTIAGALERQFRYSAASGASARNWTRIYGSPYRSNFTKRYYASKTIGELAESGNWITNYRFRRFDDGSVLSEQALTLEKMRFHICQTTGIWNYSLSTAQQEEEKLYDCIKAQYYIPNTTVAINQGEVIKAFPRTYSNGSLWNVFQRIWRANPDADFNYLSLIYSPDLVSFAPMQLLIAAAAFYPAYQYPPSMHNNIMYVASDSFSISGLQKMLKLLVPKKSDYGAAAGSSSESLEAKAFLLDPNLLAVASSIDEPMYRAMPPNTNLSTISRTHCAVEPVTQKSGCFYEIESYPPLALLKVVGANERKDNNENAIGTTEVKDPVTGETFLWAKNVVSYSPTVIFSLYVFIPSDFILGRVNNLFNIAIGLVVVIVVIGAVATYMFLRPVANVIEDLTLKLAKDPFDPSLIDDFTEENDDDKNNSSSRHSKNYVAGRRNRHNNSSTSSTTTKRNFLAATLSNSTLELSELRSAYLDFRHVIEQLRSFLPTRHRKPPTTRQASSTQRHSNNNNNNNNNDQEIFNKFESKVVEAANNTNKSAKKYKEEKEDHHNNNVTTVNKKEHGVSSGVHQTSSDDETEPSSSEKKSSSANSDGFDGEFSPQENTGGGKEQNPENNNTASSSSPSSAAMTSTSNLNSSTNDTADTAAVAVASSEENNAVNKEITNSSTKSKKTKRNKGFVASGDDDEQEPVDPSSLVPSPHLNVQSVMKPIAAGMTTTILKKQQKSSLMNSKASGSKEFASNNTSRDASHNNNNNNNVVKSVRFAIDQQPNTTENLNLGDSSQKKSSSRGSKNNDDNDNSNQEYYDDDDDAVSSIASSSDDDFIPDVVDLDEEEQQVDYNNNERNNRKKGHTLFQSASTYSSPTVSKTRLLLPPSSLSNKNNNKKNSQQQLLARRKPGATNTSNSSSSTAMKTGKFLVACVRFNSARKIYQDILNLGSPTPPSSSRNNTSNNTTTNNTDNNSINSQQDERTTKHLIPSSPASPSSSQLAHAHQALIDDIEFVVENMLDNVIVPTGAHLIEYRNEFFIVALKLSKKNVKSKLARRFVSALIDISHDVKEECDIKKRRDGQDDESTFAQSIDSHMTVGLAVSEAKIFKMTNDMGMAHRRHNNNDSNNNNGGTSGAVGVTISGEEDIIHNNNNNSGNNHSGSNLTRSAASATINNALVQNASGSMKGRHHHSASATPHLPMVLSPQGRLNHQQQNNNSDLADSDVSPQNSISISGGMMVDRKHGGSSSQNNSNNNNENSYEDDTTGTWEYSQSLRTGEGLMLNREEEIFDNSLGGSSLELPARRSDRAASSSLPLRPITFLGAAVKEAFEAEYVIRKHLYCEIEKERQKIQVGKTMKLSRLQDFHPKYLSQLSERSSLGAAQLSDKTTTDTGTRRGHNSNNHHRSSRNNEFGSDITKSSPTKTPLARAASSGGSSDDEDIKLAQVDEEEHQHLHENYYSPKLMLPFAICHKCDLSFETIKMECCFLPKYLSNGAGGGSGSTVNSTINSNNNNKTADDDNDNADMRMKLNPHNNAMLKTRPISVLTGGDENDDDNSGSGNNNKNNNNNNNSIKDDGDDGDVVVTPGSTTTSESSSSTPSSLKNVADSASNRKAKKHENNKNDNNKSLVDGDGEDIDGLSSNDDNEDPALLFGKRYVRIYSAEPILETLFGGRVMNTEEEAAEELASRYMEKRMQQTSLSHHHQNASLIHHHNDDVNSSHNNNNARRRYI